MLELVRETGQMPTTDAVADRAGVSRRSVFRHYTDVSELLTAAYELQREEAFNRYPRRDPVELTVDERIVNLTASASELYEYVTPVRKAANEMSRDYPVLLDLLQDDDALQRGIVEGMFDGLLNELKVENKAVLIEALVAVSSWSNWHAMRRYRGLSIEMARAVMAAQLQGILGLAESRAALVVPVAD